MNEDHRRSCLSPPHNQGSDPRDELSLLRWPPRHLFRPSLSLNPDQESPAVDRFAPEGGINHIRRKTSNKLLPPSIHGQNS